MFLLSRISIFRFIRWLGTLHGKENVASAVEWFFIILFSFPFVFKNVCHVWIIQNVKQSFQKNPPLHPKISGKSEKYLRGGPMTRTKHFSDYRLSGLPMVLCFYQKTSWRCLKEVLGSLLENDLRTSRRRRKNVIILVSKRSQIGLKWKSRRLFFKTSSKRLPRDVLRTSWKRLVANFISKQSKTFLRPKLWRFYDIFFVGWVAACF